MYTMKQLLKMQDIKTKKVKNNYVYIQNQILSPKRKYNLEDSK